MNIPVLAYLVGVPRLLRRDPPADPIVDVDTEMKCENKKLTKQFSLPSSRVGVEKLDMVKAKRL